MDGLALAELLPLAFAITLNPPAVIAVILLLSSSRSNTAALAFLAGWAAGLLAIAAIALVADGLYDIWSAPTWLALTVRLVLGIALIGLAAVKWFRHRSATPDEEMPGWMRSIEDLSAAKSFAGAAAFAVLNPKTLALNVAGLVVITGAGLEPVGEWAAVAIFVAVSSTTVAAPVAYQLLAPERSQTALEAVKRWLIVNNAAVTAGVLLLIGLMLSRAGVELLLAG